MACVGDLPKGSSARRLNEKVTEGTGVSSQESLRCGSYENCSKEQGWPLPSLASCFSSQSLPMCIVIHQGPPQKQNRVIQPPSPRRFQLGPAAPGPLPSLGIAFGRCAVTQASDSGPRCLQCLHFFTLLGCHFQASAFRWQFITLDLRTVCLRIACATLLVLFAFRPEVISRLPETAASASPPSGLPRPILSVFSGFTQPGKCGWRKFPG